MVKNKGYKSPADLKADVDREIDKNLNIAYCGEVINTYFNKCKRLAMIELQEEIQDKN